MMSRIGRSLVPQRLLPPRQSELIRECAEAAVPREGMSRRIRRLIRALLALGVLVSAPALARTVEDVQATLGPRAEARLAPHLQKAGFTDTPRRLLLVALKDERQLELWAKNAKGELRFVRAYAITAASGGPGPKLRQGDLQVPEGFYRLSVLNPNSAYHLSMKVDYPNAFDRRQAAGEKRTQLGGDIFIHGSDVSIGCLALGDEAIEELFTLVAKVKRQNVDVWIAPHDLRLHPAPPAQPAWMESVYAELTEKMRKLPKR
jgi:hypothetical protein